MLFRRNVTGDGIGGRPPLVADTPGPAVCLPDPASVGHTSSASPDSADGVVPVDETVPDEDGGEGGSPVIEEEEGEEGVGEQVEPSSSRKKRQKM